MQIPRYILNNVDVTIMPSIILKTTAAIIIYFAISTSNHMFGRAIWDKLPECIFENFEIARVK